MKTFRLIFNLTFVWILKTVLCVEDESEIVTKNTSVNIFTENEQNYHEKETKLSLLKNEKWAEFTEKIKNVCNMFNEIKNEQLAIINGNEEFFEVVTDLQEISYEIFKCSDYNTLISSLKQSIDLTNRFLPLVAKKNEENKPKLFLDSFKKLIDELWNIKKLLPELKEKKETRLSCWIVKIREELKELEFNIKVTFDFYQDLKNLIKVKRDYCNDKKVCLIYEIMDKKGFLTDKFKNYRENDFINNSGPIRLNFNASVSEFEFYFKQERRYLHSIFYTLDYICTCKTNIDKYLGLIEDSSNKN